MATFGVDVLQCFQNYLSNEKSSAAVAAIQTLLELIRNSKAGTLLGLREEIKQAITELTSSANVTSISVESGCELFLRFITLTSLDHPDFAECRRKLLERGAIYLEKVGISRQKIATLGNPFIRDGTTILTHSKSRVVLQLLQEAAASHKRIKVFVTESTIDKSGWEMHKQLEESKIPSKVILDSAVGYIMEKIDIVVVGAEGVVESGGIINKVGSYQMAVMAKAINKPFYVVAECFKFMRVFPLNQEDLPNPEKYVCTDTPEDHHPMIDYTPPSYISLLFTDLGVLTPSAVSDELIKLYS